MRDIKVTWSHFLPGGIFHRHATVDVISNGICQDGRSYTATID